MSWNPEWDHTRERGFWAKGFWLIHSWCLGVEDNGRTRLFEAWVGKWKDQIRGNMDAKFGE